MPTAGTCTAFVVFTHSVRSAVIDPSKFCKSDTQSWRAAWRRDQGYRVLGISYQHLNIWSIFLDISQKANTWCHQQARTKPDCALTSLAFRFCAAFMCALLALKAWHTPSRERLQTGSTKHPFNPTRSYLAQLLSSLLELGQLRLQHLPHLQSQAITDQWWIAPLGHRICLKNPKQCTRWLPKLVPKWHWNSDTSCISQ